MLETLADTALLRRWPPTLFSRLCNQLKDSVEFSQGGGLLLLRLAARAPSNILLFEYILTLALDSKSLLPFECLLQQWASESWKDRDQPSRNLIIYAGRGLAGWKPSVEKQPEIRQHLTTLMYQGAEGCEESRFFVSQVFTCGPYDWLVKGAPEWRTEMARKTQEALSSSEIDFEKKIWQQLLDQVSLVNLGNAQTADGSVQYTPSRTFRLVWLHKVVTGLMHLETSVFMQQLDVLWPNERVTTLVYELSLTAFDCYGSSLMHQAWTQNNIWIPFIVKKLPLVLKNLLEPSDLTSLDGPFNRLLATMDKDLVKAVDSAGDLRALFCKACIDLGLCEPSVLHALHQDYKPKPEDTHTVLGVPVEKVCSLMITQNESDTKQNTSFIAKLIGQFPGLGALGQSIVVREINELTAQPLSVPLRVFANLCLNLGLQPFTADQLFLHLSVKQFLQAMVCRVDSVSSAVDADSMYSDVAIITSFVHFFCARYNISRADLVEGSSWALNYIFEDVGAHCDLNKLNSKRKDLAGGWLMGMFGGHGVRDDNFAALQELLAIVPVLVQQSLTAYESEAMDREAFEGGMDYFLQPFLIPVLPVVFKVIARNFWEHQNIKAAVALASMLLKTLLERKAQPIPMMILTYIHNDLARLEARLRVDIPGASVLKNEIHTAVELTSAANKVLNNGDKYDGSIVSAVTSTVKNLYHWQRRPSGVPPIKISAIERAEKVVGPAKTLEAIENALESNYPGREVEVAILVLYGSRCFSYDPPEVPLLSLTGREIPFTVAKEYERTFSVMFDTCEQPIEATRVLVEQREEQQAKPTLASTPRPPAELPSLGNDSFNDGLDMYAGVPMDMDELDEAMDFNAWQ